MAQSFMLLRAQLALQPHGQAQMQLQSKPLEILTNGTSVRTVNGIHPRLHQTYNTLIVV